MPYSYTDLLANFGIGGAHPGGLALTKALLEELDIEGETHFLEVGCGTGQTSSYIFKHYPCNLYCVDQHSTMIKKTKERFSSLPQNLSILEASAEKLPFPDNKFNFILSESVTAFTNIEASLKEYYRTLKSNGGLVLIEMTANKPLLENEIHELKFFYEVKDILTEDQWVYRLDSAGFQEINALTISLDELHAEQEFTEFNISPNTSPELFDILDQHEYLTGRYKEQLGFLVFLCKKP